MKTIIYLLIWLNCSCPSNNIILTPTTMTYGVDAVSYMTADPVPRCEPKIKFVGSLDPLLEQMAQQQKDWGTVQPRTVPDRIYKLTLKGGKVIESVPVEIEPVIEKRTEWIEQEKRTIKGFKVK